MISFYSFNFCGVGLTVSLSIFRYIFVFHQKLSTKMCSTRRSKITIFAVVCCVVLKRTVIITTEVYSSDHFFESFGRTFLDILLITAGVVPSMVLAVFTILMATKLKTSKRHHTSMVKKKDRTARKENRTTYILLIIVLTTILAEIHWAIYGFLNVTSNVHIYVPEHFSELLILINSSINFILYCVMSEQFNETFRHIFIPAFMQRIFQIYCKRRHAQESIELNYIDNPKIDEEPYNNLKVEIEEIEIENKDIELNEVDNRDESNTELSVDLRTERKMTNLTTKTLSLKKLKISISGLMKSHKNEKKF